MQQYICTYISPATIDFISFSVSLSFVDWSLKYHVFIPSFEWYASVTFILVPSSLEEHTHTHDRSKLERPTLSDTLGTLWTISSPRWLITGWVAPPETLSLAPSVGVRTNIDFTPLDRQTDRQQAASNRARGRVSDLSFQLFHYPCDDGSHTNPPTETNPSCSVATRLPEVKQYLLKLYFYCLLTI